MTEQELHDFWEEWREKVCVEIRCLLAETVDVDVPVSDEDDTDEIIEMLIDIEEQLS